MKRAFLIALLALVACPVRAQEIYFNAGGLLDTNTKEHTYTWSLSYMQGLQEHLAVSFSWLNEGHVPGHHRDGHTVQFWGRTNVFNRRLSLAAGVGPYRYFDTSEASEGASYSDSHGWGAIFSLAATYYTEKRWLLQLRTNYVETGGYSYDTFSVALGIGYQLDPPPSPGPLPKAPSQCERTTDNEITVFIGQTIVNSFDSEKSVSASIEYRRGLWRYVDWTFAYMYEGDNRLVRRGGLITQLWAVRAFFNKHLALGVGGGIYIAVDQRRDEQPDESGAGTVAAIVTMTASYRFFTHWAVRASWNRIMTNYDRDTDILVAGVGYRF